MQTTEGFDEKRDTNNSRIQGKEGFKSKNAKIIKVERKRAANNNKS